jgi:hypothetical protein
VRWGSVGVVRYEVRVPGPGRVELKMLEDD